MIVSWGSIWIQNRVPTMNNKKAPTSDEAAKRYPWKDWYWQVPLWKPWMYETSKVANIPPIFTAITYLSKYRDGLFDTGTCSAPNTAILDWIAPTPIALYKEKTTGKKELSDECTHVKMSVPIIAPKQRSFVNEVTFVWMFKDELPHMNILVSVFAIKLTSTYPIKYKQKPLRKM